MNLTWAEDPVAVDLLRGSPSVQGVLWSALKAAWIAIRRRVCTDTMSRSSFLTAISFISRSAMMHPPLRMAGFKGQAARPVVRLGVSDERGEWNTVVRGSRMLSVCQSSGRGWTNVVTYLDRHQVTLGEEVFSSAMRRIDRVLSAEPSCSRRLMERLLRQVHEARESFISN